MEELGAILRQRYERIVVENEMLRAGFAAVPYLVLRDTRLTVGARLAYSVLLMYAWQAGSCFPGQARMATDLGVSERHLRRFLAELRDAGYISWRKLFAGGTNTYTIHDVSTKLKKGKLVGTGASAQRGHRRPVSEDVDVRLIDSDTRPREIDPVLA